MKLNNKEIDILGGIINDYLKTVLKFDDGEEKIYIRGRETNKNEILKLKNKFK